MPKVVKDKDPATTKPKAPKDPNKPKGRCTAYAFFIKASREEYKGTDTPSFGDFSKMCSEKWKVIKFVHDLHNFLCNDEWLKCNLDSFIFIHIILDNGWKGKETLLGSCG